MTVPHIVFLIFVWFLIALCTYRITRFITRDIFPPMKWFREHTSFDDDTNRPDHRWRFVPNWFADLISCPWCASLYVAGAITWIVDLTIDGGLPVPILFAGAAWATATWPLLWEDAH